ncbi:response regulator transcription factor [Sandarakinorhabdus sp.]|uniref:response regulator transcription factor n=1 Tax=Sandarakinorhabdus sp. TaxID=1916663 RepID=UPI003F6EBA86
MTDSEQQRAVYIIDDDALVRASVAAQMTSLGIEARAFAGAREFLDTIDELRPGIVLLDVRMPELDGITFLSTHRTNLADFAVIVMTAYGDIATAVRAMKIGAIDFIEKPFNMVLLKSMLEQAFGLLERSQGHVQDRRAAVDAIGQLTARERDVLRGLLAGGHNKQVAHQLGLSVRTVEMHRANMMRRLQVKSLSEALKLAIAAEIDTES